MIELENLLNDLYQGLPIGLYAAASVTPFLVPKTFKDRKIVFEILDSLFDESSEALIAKINIDQESQLTIKVTLPLKIDDARYFR